MQTSIITKGGQLSTVTLPVVRLFCDILLHIKDIVLEYLDLNYGLTYTNRDIKWVLTVPAMWRASARDVMRQAAKEVHMYVVTCTSWFHHCDMDMWLHPHTLAPIYMLWLMPDAHDCVCAHKDHQLLHCVWYCTLGSVVQTRMCLQLVSTITVVVMSPWQEQSNSCSSDHCTSYLCKIRTRILWVYAQTHVTHGSRLPAWKRRKTRRRFNRDAPVFFRAKMSRNGNMSFMNMHGRTNTPSSGTRPQWLKWSDTPVNCCSRKPSTSTWPLLRNTSITPDEERLNRDTGLELPRCWLATLTRQKGRTNWAPADGSPTNPTNSGNSEWCSVWP